MIRQEILFPELDSAMLSLVEMCGEVYLVGGAVRDYLLHSKCNDIDFVVRKDAIRAARNIADRLNGKFYVLDDERGTGRVLLGTQDDSLVIDFATMTGANITEDLNSRDFTINAIALNIDGPDELVDPLGGAGDLRARVLRPCNSLSFDQDPVRTIRAVRFLQGLGLSIDESSQNRLKSAVPLLQGASLERKRDEIFHVFEVGGIKHSCELLREFGIWYEIFPEIAKLETDQRFPPHVHSLVDHTLQVLHYCEILLRSVRSGINETDNPHLRAACDMLREFQPALQGYLDHPIHPQRKMDGLLYLSVLYHDIGKTITPIADGHSRSIAESHAEVSADFFRTIESQWALSNDESLFIDHFIRNHSIQYVFQNAAEIDPKVSIYRYYKKTGMAGALLAIFYLADVLSAYEDTISEERWGEAMKDSRMLLDGWFNHYRDYVSPPVLIDGDDIMAELNLRPGRAIGETLELVREAQVRGEIKNKNEALRFIHALSIRKEGSIK